MKANAKFDIISFSGYSFFNHSAWNGLTVADLVFPWFMWIMGVSLVISIQSQLRKSTSRLKLFVNVLRRSVILFCLGLVINSNGGNNDFRTMRIPGVLQRFGITYFIVGSIQVSGSQPLRNCPFLKKSISNYVHKN